MPPGRRRGVPDSTDFALPGMTVNAARTSATLLDLPMAVTICEPGLPRHRFVSRGLGWNR